MNPPKMLLSVLYQQRELKKMYSVKNEKIPLKKSIVMCQSNHVQLRHCIITRCDRMYNFLRIYLRLHTFFDVTDNKNHLLFKKVLK